MSRAPLVLITLIALAGCLSTYDGGASSVQPAAVASIDGDEHVAYLTAGQSALFYSATIGSDEDILFRLNSSDPSAFLTGVLYEEHGERYHWRTTTVGGAAQGELGFTVDAGKYLLMIVASVPEESQLYFSISRSSTLTLFGPTPASYSVFERRATVGLDPPHEFQLNIAINEQFAAAAVLTGDLTVSAMHDAPHKSLTYSAVIVAAPVGAARAAVDFNRFGESLHVERAFLPPATVVVLSSTTVGEGPSDIEAHLLGGIPFPYVLMIHITTAFEMPFDIEPWTESSLPWPIPPVA